jgi:hypothetical protein
MATDVFINIKDLPEITDVKSGDYFIIETSTGTNIVNFKNLIIPTANTVISTTVDQNTTGLTNLSSSMTSQFATVNASVTDVNSKVSAVSGRLDNLDVLKANIAKTQIVITSGNRQNSGSLSKAGTWTVSDIMISPANAYAAKFPAYPVSVTADGLITIRGTFMGQDIVTYVPTPLGINSTITSTSALSTQRTGDFVQSLSVNTDNINTFISNLTLSTFDIVAEQDAIYNVYAINFSS